MADKFVRARCVTTGAIAALPERALELGHIRNWVKADGPVPDRPKPRRPRRNQPSETATESEE